jgi:hypothetical protein
MKVYVVRTHDRWIIGIYLSKERAEKKKNEVDSDPFNKAELCYKPATIDEFDVLK